MKHEPEFVDRAAFLRALAGKPARQRASGPRARQERKQDKDTTTTTATHSEPGEGDQHGALMRLSGLHYYVCYQPPRGFFFWSPYSDVTTTPHARYADAVMAAEKELRER